MIVWGSGSDLIALEHGEMQPCTTCGQSRMFKNFLQYKYFHLYWVFGAVTERKYLQLCDICRRGTQIPKDHLSLFNLQAVPIPLMRRFGLLIFAGLIGAIALWSVYLGQ